MVEKVRIDIVGALVFLLICGMFGHASAQESRWDFQNYTTSDGLSQMAIAAILQDSNGFIWVGSQIGLDRFDGSTFSTIDLKAEESGISFNSVTSICEANDGQIWLGTEPGGLYRYNPRTGDARQFVHVAGDSGSLSSNSVNCFMDKDRGEMLFRHPNGSIQSYDDSNERFVRSPLSDWADFERGVIIDLHRGVDGEVWLVGNDGSYNRVKLNSEGQVVQGKKFKIPEDFLGSKFYISASVLNGDELLLGTSDGRLIKVDNAFTEPKTWSFSAEKLLGWDITDIGYNNGKYFISSLNGLWSFDPSSKYFEKIEDAEDKLCSRLVSLFLDSEKSFWIGGEGCGLYKQESKKPFEKYLSQSNGSSDLGMAPWSFSEDLAGGVWIGTTEGGISKFNPFQKSFKTYKASDISTLSSDQILDLIIDSENTMWVASSHDLLRYELSLKDGEYEIGRLLEDIDIGYRVWEIIQDSKGDYWLGTESAGVLILDGESRKVSEMTIDGNESVDLSQRPVHTIYEDSKGFMWIGTYGLGLLKYHPESRTAKYFVPEGKEYSFIDNISGPIIEDLDGNIWVGSDRGIAKYEESDDSWTRYSKSNSALPDDTIYSFETDHEGQLWISTNKGISKLNSITGEFTNYGMADGLQDLEFNFQSSLYSSSGQLYFGGPKGLNFVNPKKMLSTQTAPAVTFTKLKVLSEEIEPGEARPLSEFLPFTNKIELNAEQNFFEIDYVANAYAHSGNYYFQYRLDGFDKDWIDHGQKESLSYTNLDPGNYILNVRSSVGGRNWNPVPSTLNISILPPWYKSSLAYLLWFFLAVSAVYAIIHLAIQSEKRELQKSELERQRKELERERSTNDRLRELDKLKSVFLANMSHEIRTPLTSIIGFADYLSESLPEEHIEYAQYILNGGHRLMDTINSVLDLAQLEGKAIDLQCEKHDLDELIPLFLSVFGTKKDVSAQVDLQFENRKGGPILVLADQGALQRIVINLVGNALKFTKEGEVVVSIDEKDGEAQIVIRDSGEGIDKKFLPDLFQMFSQESKGANRLHEGSGLGLAITKQLIDLMSGRIEVQSTKREGSQFTVFLKPFVEESSSASKDIRDQGVLDSIPL